MNNRFEILGAKEFPAAWEAILQQRVPIYQFLSEADRQELRSQAGVYTAWARILAAEYEELKRGTDKGQKTVMDSYGASNPAEFFAVATECFFEKPKQLLKKHPRLYEELKQFYKQDPANWRCDSGK